MNYEKAWLNYRELPVTEFTTYTQSLCYSLTDSVMKRAIEEITEAVKQFYGTEIVCRQCEPDQLAQEKGIILLISNKEELGTEGYALHYTKDAFFVEGTTSVGVLYGVFGLLRQIACGTSLEKLKKKQIPSNPLRMLNHWDNMDGTIERGYSGSSFFFQHHKVIVNQRTEEYARLAASVGINAVVINNVNVRSTATFLITDKYIFDLRQMGDIFASYGIRLFLSVNYAAPYEMKELDTADPLDEGVCEWWKKQVQILFENVPGFGGFLVKADSEGRPGPFTYGRNHAEGANMLANAVKPYGGIIIWRCFVYNCQQDWRDTVTDRARSSYDNFKPLDGQFMDNVILQIKNGPMDFQVREPVSPLFGAMPATNQMLEVQIAQEYTGQQRHVCYLLPMFEQILHFKTYCGQKQDMVKDIVSGKTYGNHNCGMAAVANTGDDANWTGHDLAAANFYGFGRLSFDMDLTSEEIAKEWIQMTFGSSEKVKKAVEEILMKSWPTYESYTSPLGIGWMVNPNYHYGPNVDGYEYQRWGTYHRADHLAIGVDRTSKGTGYATQYFEPNSKRFESMEECPEELLLFFHRVPYSYMLKTGKTLIQHIYDSHFEGVEEVEKMLDLWRTIQDEVDPMVYDRVMQRMDDQLEHSKEWRDVICSYFYRKTGIEDAKGRKIY